MQSHFTVKCLGLAHEKIKQRVLYLQVMDYDRFSRNDPIGEICLPLHTVNLAEETLHNLPLQMCEGSVSFSCASAITKSTITFTNTRRATRGNHHNVSTCIRFSRVW